MIGTSRNASRVADRDGVTFLDLDVASDESVTAVVQVIERYGRLDVLVNDAGIGSSGAAEETSVAQDQSVFDINVLGVIRMTKAVLPQMRAQRRGRIINVSSILGFIPQPFMAVYAASKHAVEGYSESLDHEIRERGLVTAPRRGAAVGSSRRWSGAAHQLQPDAPLQARSAGSGGHRCATRVDGGDDLFAVDAAAVDRGCAGWRPQLQSGRPAW